MEEAQTEQVALWLVSHPLLVHNLVNVRLTDCNIDASYMLPVYTVGFHNDGGACMGPRAWAQARVPRRRGRAPLRGPTGRTREWAKGTLRPLARLPFVGPLAAGDPLNAENRSSLEVTGYDSARCLAEGRSSTSETEGLPFP